MKIVVIPGDGIGPETMAVATDVLQAVSQKFNLNLQLEHELAGHDSLKKHGATVTDATMDWLVIGPSATMDKLATSFALTVNVLLNEPQVTV